MRWIWTVMMCSVVFTGCVRRPCQALGNLFGCDCVSKRAQPGEQDMSIQLPEFDSNLTADTDLDGYTLQAIRIAADDYLASDPTGLPCEYRQSSYQYRTHRQVDVIFVRIELKPESCGREVGMLDDGATYAISLDGRILRYSLDGLGP